MAAESRSTIPAVATRESPAEVVRVEPVEGPEAPVASRLFAEGFYFDFFQAVRLLQNLDGRRRPVGHDAVPGAEAVRFRVQNSLTFPPSSIHEIAQPDNEWPLPVMTVAFFGLTGPSGVLPRHYTELVYRTQRDIKDANRYVLRDWFDLFNHRMIALFYRAWSKYRPWLAYEAGAHAAEEPDPFTRALLSLVGIGTRGLRRRLRVACREMVAGRSQERVLTKVDDLALTFYGGLLAHRPRCADGLEALLSDYSRLPVKVQQFQGEWLTLDPTSRSSLSEEGGNNELGVNAVSGDRVWNIQNKVRLRIGPLSLTQFDDLLPDRSPVPQRKHFFELMHLTRFYIGPELDVDVQLVLRGDEVPECQLPESTGDGPQLGWNTWTRSQALTRDPGDAIFEGDAVVWVSEEPGAGAMP